MARRTKTKTPKDYIWREGYQNKGIRAEAAARELERISRESGGEITKAAVIAAASVESSPIHQLFEWDDEKAAALYRKKQAGALLTSLIVVYEGAGGRALEVPYVVSYRPEQERARGATGSRSYVMTHEARRNPEIRQAVVERAWDELLGWRTRYEHLSEFMGVRAAIDKARAEAA